ncbi:transcription factor TFIIH subunit p52/Tfb2 [Podospora didyma]|uniref:RNA polymerase II transcription factor B subunit 2 n=1 Tax=Podospora didyma TaxID=330526 RepID=A0AAE0TW63_9PEZI|nr:transcription factor TFIIH subunit p52/Tfb2 [Podospora didyma]
MSGTQSYQLSDYLEKLPATTFRKLYQQPSTAFAIFRRMLPPLAKVFVQALLYMPSPLLLSQLDDVWVKSEGRQQRDRALAILRSLHIVQITPSGKDKPQEMQLTTNFKNSMRLALEGGGSHLSFGVPSALPVDPSIDIPFLDKYSRKKWEDILHYVVNSVSVYGDIGGGGSSGGSAAGPRPSVKDLLLAGHLVERRPDSKSGIVITQAGFTFLLQESNAQVWTLLLLWLEASDHAKGAANGGRGGAMMDSIDMLSFLFMLASLELGRAYDTESLTETRRNMLPDLVDFGLIFVPRENPRQYFPTRLATTLTSSASALRSVSAGFAAATANASGDAASLGAVAGANSAAAAESKGSIIVETNYRIYAYTSSPLQIAVLALFTQLNMRFAGMVTGRLTRDSIRRAISYGITADQIISYLAAHAHEQMSRTAAATGRPILPPTVVDQIRLWQLENERMRTTAGYLFRDFESPAEFAALTAYAEEIGVLVWKNEKKNLFFVSKYEQLRDYLKSRKK